MNDLIKQFPDATKKNRKAVMYVPETPDNEEFRKTFLRGLRDAVLIGLLFAIGLICTSIMWLCGNGNAD